MFTLQTLCKSILKLTIPHPFPCYAKDAVVPLDSELTWGLSKTTDSTVYMSYHSDSTQSSIYVQQGAVRPACLRAQQEAASAAGACDRPMSSSFAGRPEAGHGGCYNPTTPHHTPPKIPPPPPTSPVTNAVSRRLGLTRRWTEMGLTDRRRRRR